MSKNQNKQKSSIKSATAAQPQPIQADPENTSWVEKYGKYILLIFGFLMYANTLGHDYTQDDAIVIYDNMFTQKGVSGIGGLLTNDTFYGFFKKEGKDKLVSGGRYRPFTPIMFAIEYQIFKKKPFVGHLINALLYGLLAFFIFKLLAMIFVIRNDYKEHYLWIIFASCLIYIAHPLHTEAVANIKGRDEIMSMMGAILATIYTIKYMQKEEMNHAIIAFASFFMGLMSKENAITFLAVIPIILVYFYDKPFSSTIKWMVPTLAATFLFLICRTYVLGMDMGGTSPELMNNPYLKLVGEKYIPFSFGEKMSTIIYTLGYYIKLLFVPHPLTSDYYPRQIDIMSFGDVNVLMSLSLYIAMVWAIFYFYKKDRVISFTMIYFLITLSIVSNIVFPIGTNMSERFMFMPSLAFCLFLPHFIYKWIKNGKTVFGISMVVVVLFATKTIMRNQVWKNDFTLFTTDVKISNKSAKMLNAAGGALSTEASKEKDNVKKTQMLNQAVAYLNDAVKIHPQYTNAHLLMGNSYFYLGELEKSIAAYENALKHSPNFFDAKNNLAVALRDAGRKAGEKENNIPKAQQLLLKSLSLSPGDIETNRLLGISYGLTGRHAEAIPYFKKVTELDPKNASGFLNLSSAYSYNGDVVNAQKYKAIAIQMDPKLNK